MEALFSVGQKIVCVDSGPSKIKKKRVDIGILNPPLIEGKTYPCLENRQCDCGHVAIDVGLRGPIAGSICGCGREISEGDIWYVSQFRFVPLDDDRAMDEQIRESLNLHLIEK